MEKKYFRLSKWAALFAVLAHSPALAVESAPPGIIVQGPSPNYILENSPPSASLLIKRGPLFRHSTYPVAWTAAQKTNRPILVYVSMPNCPHCVKMVNESYRKPQVETLIEGSFETIKAGRYTHAKLVSKLKIKWYPTTVLVAPNNKVLDVIEGYVGPRQFKQRLQTGLASMRKPTRTQIR